MNSHPIQGIVIEHVTLNGRESVTLVMTERKEGQRK